MHVEVGKKMLSNCYSLIRLNFLVSYFGDECKHNNILLCLTVSCNKVMFSLLKYRFAKIRNKIIWEKLDMAIESNLVVVAACYFDWTCLCSFCWHYYLLKNLVFVILKWQSLLEDLFYFSVWQLIYDDVSHIFHRLFYQKWFYPIPSFFRCWTVMYFGCKAVLITV